MKEKIETRVIDVANYMIKETATVRATATKFGLSKSTVHKDITERLLRINPNLASAARQVLNLNKSQRHIRGGNATKQKYMTKNEKINV